MPMTVAKLFAVVFALVLGLVALAFGLGARLRPVRTAPEDETW